MQIRLERLTLQNFKGTRYLSIDFGGNNADIRGDNATGKTTIMDAFTWLFFGKDSLNHADFEIKCLDADGNPEHGLEHMVEARISTEGHAPSYVATFKKIYREKWVKQRGLSEKIFAGHTVDYFVDGVPVKEKEYKERIDSISDEQTFRLLTNPRHFSENMKWQDRRQVLLDVCGDITDADVIVSDDKISELPAILGNRSIDDHRKVLAGQKREINSQLEQIPSRIDELNRSITTDILTPDKIKFGIGVLQAEKGKCETALVNLESGGEIAEKTKQVHELASKIQELDNLAQADNFKKQAEQNKAIREVQNAITALLRRENNSRVAIIKNQDQIADHEAEMVRLRDEWSAINAQGFTTNGICPTCRQTIPQEQIQAANAEFQHRKAEQLKDISAKGKTLRDAAMALVSEGSRLQAQIDKTNAEIEQLEAEIRTLNSIAITTEPSKEREKLYMQKEALESETESIRNNRAGWIDETKTKIADLDAKIAEQNRLLAQAETNAKALARIEQLKAEERKLAGEFNRIEKELFLCDEFVKRKVNLLTDRINSRFKITRFKLFNQNINGGIEPCCEVTVEGVPHGSINNSMRILSGLDIIETLSTHHGLYLPIWIDNAESTTRFPEMTNQMIRLYVSEADKQLRIVLEKENGRTAKAA